ncbi:MAG TPA: hypothetical protein VFR81_22275 [Longimicrobium sp.]|nr:hypothetical protein [Longimicrobium sp.]
MPTATVSPIEPGPAVTEGFPVEGFPIRYSWHAGEWKAIFDRQTELVRGDVMRARLEDRMVIYLSVPISKRGGSFEATNVDIAMATERRLLEQWGEAVWVLNPARYQMESKGGYGLIESHARAEGIDLAALLRGGKPSGGDYMRMWTKVLVEDGDRNLGERFDAYYFLGPSDVDAFFGGPGTATQRIEGYFAAKYATDAAFRHTYAGKNEIAWGRGDLSSFGPEEWKPLEEWEAARRDFIRFYILRASGNYSLGSHDEWNTWVLLNRQRLKKFKNDTGRLIPGFFDGRQVDPAAAVTLTSNGYGVVTP